MSPYPPESGNLYHQPRYAKIAADIQTEVINLVVDANHITSSPVTSLESGLSISNFPLCPLNRVSVGETTVKKHPGRTCASSSSVSWSCFFCCTSSKLGAMMYHGQLMIAGEGEAGPCWAAWAPLPYTHSRGTAPHLQPLFAGMGRPMPTIHRGYRATC